jgi:gliding motility-associated-like protein
VVTVVDEDGCTANDTMIIRVNKLRPIYIPNVFNPESGTFPNDWFTLFGGPAAESVELLRIYDRWGSLVFEKTDFALNEPNLGWDGTYKGEKLFGVFAFYAKVRFVDQVSRQYEGDVTVLR